ncbi:MAG: hypothetical protein ACT4OX_07240 [Actinomycetota bacterium]
MHHWPVRRQYLLRPSVSRHPWALIAIVSAGTLAVVLAAAAAAGAGILAGLLAVPFAALAVFIAIRLPHIGVLVHETKLEVVNWHATHRSEIGDITSVRMGSGHPDPGDQIVRLYTVHISVRTRRTPIQVDAASRWRFIRSRRAADLVRRDADVIRRALNLEPEPY